MRSYQAVLLSVLVAGCGFEGQGDLEEAPEDDGSATNPGGDPKPDPVKPVVCPGFDKVGASYYTVSTETMPRGDARAYCQSRPNVTTAHLVTFETLEEITAVKDAFATQLSVPAWTGVVQIKSGFSRTYDYWRNLVAQKVIPANFPWLDGEPNDGSGFYNENGQEDFAELRSNGRFDDGPADRLNRAMCECEAPVSQ